MPLTDGQVKAAKPRDKAYKLGDRDGLVLRVSAAGNKVWRFNFMLAGVNKTQQLGTYPEMGLKEARAALIEARAEIRKGRNPVAMARVARITAGENTFAMWADRYYQDHTGRPLYDPMPDREAKRPRSQWCWTYERDTQFRLQAICKLVGSVPLVELRRVVLAEALRTLGAKHGLHSAAKMRSCIGSVCEHAAAGGVEFSNPTPPKNLAPPPDQHFAAAGTIQEARAVLAAAEQARGATLPSTVLAHRFLALTAARPEMVCGARWSEMDLEAGLWRVPASRMKGKAQHKQPHTVPLSDAAVELLRIARMLPAPEGNDFVFLGNSWGRLSLGSLQKYLKRGNLPVPHVPHGWRAAFSTVMNDQSPDDGDVVEAALAHSQGGVRGIYNRGRYLEWRKELMQKWATLLLEGQLPVGELVNCLSGNVVYPPQWQQAA